MSFINQYSYLLTSIFVTVIIAFFLVRDGLSRRDVIAIASIVGAFVIAWFFIRPTPSNIAQDQIESMLKSGKPMLIEFQSEYWLACIAAQPVVDSIETNIKDKANVIHLNIQSEIGQLYASRFNARTVPTFVMLNSKSEVAWTMVGRVDPNKVYDSLK